MGPNSPAQVWKKKPAPLTGRELPSLPQVSQRTAPTSGSWYMVSILPKPVMEKPWELRGNQAVFLTYPRCEFPCMAYLPTFGVVLGINVGKYTIHWASGICNCTFPETKSKKTWKLMVGSWKTTFLLGRHLVRCYISFREGDDLTYINILDIYIYSMQYAWS